MLRAADLYLFLNNHHWADLPIRVLTDATRPSPLVESSRPSTSYTADSSHLQAAPVLLQVQFRALETPPFTARPACQCLYVTGKSAERVGRTSAPNTTRPPCVAVVAFQ